MTFRRTVLILFWILVLCIAADWKQFRDDARPALQPLVAWSERQLDDAPTSHNVSTDVSSVLRPVSESSLPGFRQEVSRLRSEDATDDLHRRVAEWRLEDLGGASRKRYAHDISLVRVRTELEQVQHEIQRLQDESARRYELLGAESLRPSDRKTRILQLDTDFKQKLKPLEDRRDRLQAEIERIADGRERLVNR